MPESKNSPARRRGVTMALIGIAIFMWAPHAALAEGVISRRDALSEQLRLLPRSSG